MKKLIPLALFLSLLCHDAQAGTSFIRGWFFSVGVHNEIPPMSCDNSVLLLSIPYTNTSNNVTWLAGGFMCQKISNSLPIAVKIKSLSFQALTNVSGPAPIMTGRIRDNPNITLGSDYGQYSTPTNQSRDGVYFDLNWPNGAEPTIPPLTDFYIGATIEGTSAVKLFVRQAGTYYLDMNYAAYNDGVILTNSDYYLDIYNCQ